MNLAGELLGKTKSAVPLATAPVGAAGWLPPDATGIKALTPVFFVPIPLYTVETPGMAPLSATHHGLVAVRVKPQAFISWLSRGFVAFVPTPGILETRFVRVYCCANA